jgi:hypothetical protein
LADVASRCTEVEQPINFCVLIKRPEIEVESILGNTVLGHSKKKDSKGGFGGRSNLDFRAIFMCNDPVECSSPPVAKGPRIV